jgi:hypothetical protein
VAREKRTINVKSLISSVILMLVIAAITTGAYLYRKSPVPESIRSQVDFTVLCPKSYDIDGGSWRVDTSDGTRVLTFVVRAPSANITFSQQELPIAYKTDDAAYDRFIGSLKPRANFRVPLGTVSIVNFVSEGNYKSEGASGLLSSEGTLLTAHPDKEISEREWYEVMESLVAY